jgi:archaellum component FlaC
MTDRNLLEGILEQLGAMNSRFDGIDKRLDTMDSKFDAMDKRLDTIDDRLGKIEETVEEIQEDTRITRSAVNSLIEWAEEVGVITQVKYPIKRVE